MGHHYFGMFRIEENAPRVINLVDGTRKVIPVVPNAIDSGSPDVRFEDRKLTKKLANELYERDRKLPNWLTLDGNLG